MAGYDASTHEQVKIPVPVQIHLAHWPSAVRFAGANTGGFAPSKVITHDRRQLSGTGFVIRHTRNQRRAATGRDERQHHRLIPTGWLQNLRRDGLERAILFIAKHGQAPTGTAADDQVIPAVAIDVVPAQSGAGLAVFERDKQLPTEIFIRFVGMLVPDCVRNVAEERRRLGWRRLGGVSVQWLRNNISVIWLGRFYGSLPTSWPSDVYFKLALLHTEGPGRLA